MGTPKPQHILVLDDTKTLADMYAHALSLRGYKTAAFYTGKDLIAHLAQTDTVPDLLVLDLTLPDINGLDLLADLHGRGFNAPVIVITGNGSINIAVESMRLGAADFLLKPFPIEKLGESIARALGAAGLSLKAKVVSEHEALAPHLDNAEAEETSAGSRARSGFGGFVGTSPPMQIIYDIIENAAKSNATVFITGESGTGKEICAEAIHKHSRRKNAPFVAINCAAIPRELLESELFGHVKGAFTGASQDRNGAVTQAHGGTLFLDEIAEMAPDMQTKLLRFLQNLSFQKVGSDRIEKANIRIICATNRMPAEEIAAGRLRQDLFYRLHVIPIHMPPLRQRAGDIIDLGDYFLKLYGQEEGKSFREFSPAAERLLLDYHWPGNVRELQNIVRGIVVLHDRSIVTPAMMPAQIVSSTGYGAFVEPQTEQLDLAAGLAARLRDEATLNENDIAPLWQIEKQVIEQAILACDGNIPKAAARLEISPSTIYRKKMNWDRGGVYAQT